MVLIYIFFVGLLVWLSIPLRHTWSDGTYYDYGWLIPPMVIWFFYRRWKLTSKNESLVGKTGKQSSWITPIIIGCVFLLLSLAIRTFENVDVTWRVILWIHAGLVFATIHVLLAFLMGWRKSLKFWPVTLLGLMAAPLPSALENQLVGSMTQKVTDVAVFSLQWMGFPVQATGGTISGPSGSVEVGKACSGIRSFQAIIVTAWFFGEFLWCKLWARFALLIIGMIAAFATNVIRAVTLAWVKFEHGVQAFEKWHDPIGYIAFAAAGLILFIFARKLDEPEPQTGKDLKKNIPKARLQKPIRICGVCLVAIVLTEILVKIHFKNNKASTDLITYRFPAPDTNGFKRINMGILPESDVLKFDGGGSGVFFDETPNRSMRTVYLEYRRGNPRFWMDMFAHAPEVCMGSGGSVLEQRFPNRKATIAGFPLEFESLKFKSPTGETIFIFKGYWLESTLPDQLDNLRSLRVKMARKGERSPEGRLFWAATTNIREEQEAWSYFRSKFIDHVTKL